MSTPKLSLLAFVLASGLLGGFLAAASRPSDAPLEGLSLSETQMSDRLFYWRDKLYAGAVPVDPRLVLVGLDEDALALLDKPDIFWDEDLAAVTQALLDGGASVVGLDFLRNPPMGHAPKVVQDIIAARRDDMMDCLSGDHTVIIEFLDGATIRTWPENLVRSAGGGRNSCIANIRSDPDGVVRRVPFPSKASTDGKDKQAAGFSARLTEIGSGQEMQSVSRGELEGGGAAPSSTRGSTWSFQNRPVLLDPGNDLRVNYPGPAGTIPKVALAGLLRRVREHKPLDEFKGKIAIIMPDFFNDRHAAPSMIEDNQQTLGAEIHAAAINTYLTGRYLQLAPAWQWNLAVVAVAVIVCLVFSQLGILLASASSAVGLLAYYFACVWLFARQGVLMPLVGPALVAFAAAILGLFARYLSSEQARTRAHRILSRMVSPQVASVVLRGSDSPEMGGSRRDITVLFSDINQFTPTCEKLQPEQVIEMLNEFFAEMVLIIHHHGGYVKQFVGDEIMAIFGAPEDLKDHPRKAVECAVAMFERLKELKNREPKKIGFYSVKVGINTGSAVVGQVGSVVRSEYAAVGDDVNLAARLESLTTSLGVSNLVSPATKDLCREIPRGWAWKSMGKQKFKGKSVEMEVWTLVEEASATDES